MRKTVGSAAFSIQVKLAELNGIEMKLGSVVYSKSGRDSGSYYAVVEIVSEEFVKIADGERRKLIKPKLKRVKHLKDTGSVLERIGEKLAAAAVVYDAEIRSALRAFNENL